MPLTKILIADDHLSVRIGMRMLAEDALGNCQATFASNGKQLFQLLAKEPYDILITDLNMPEADMFQLVPKALSWQPSLKILVMSVNPEAVFARRMLAAGAYCYLQKDAPDDDIMKAIKSIALGKKYITASQLDNLNTIFLQEQGNGSPFNKLSSRELEVTFLLLKGQGPLEIANALSISSSTASTFKARVYEKLGVANLIDLNALAQLHSISDPGATKHP